MEPLRKCGAWLRSLTWPTIIQTTSLLVLGGLAVFNSYETMQWRGLATRWQKISDEQANTIILYESAVRRLREMAQYSADQASVCVSMLPAEQRRSLMGQ
jgi:hypothetical protein